MRQNEPQGFIALITAILLGIIIMVIAITLSTTSYFTRGQVLDAEYKERSRALAESCINVALLRIAANPTSPATGTVTIGSDSCAIASITGTPTSGYSISANASFPSVAIPGKTYTYLQIQTGTYAANLSITAWKECPTANPC
jgi:hypothetical protein